MPSNKANIFIIFFFAAFLSLAATAFFLFKPFFNAIAWAIILSLVFFPAQQFLTKIMVGKRSLSAFIITLIALVIVIIPCLIIFLTLVKQGLEFYRQANSYLEGTTPNNMFQNLKDKMQFLGAEEKLAPLGITLDNIKDYLLRVSNALGSFLLAQTKTMIINIFSFLIGVFFTIFTLFFLLRDGEQLFIRIKELLPLKKDDAQYIFRTLYDTTRGVVIGLAVSAILQGVLLFGGYFISGIPNYTFWGILTLFAAFIPIVGVGLIWVPVCVYAFVSLGAGKGIFLLIWGAIAIILADDFVRPYLISEKVNIHVLLLFLSVLGGLHVFGFIGIFLGPLIMATLIAFIKIYKREYLSHPEDLK